MAARWTRLPVAATALASACLVQRPPPIPTPAADATCYEIRYTPDSASLLFPRFLALNPGRDSGTTFWLPASTDTLGVYRMFYVGRWRRLPPDSLRMRFGSFTVVDLSTLVRSDSLVGVATWYSDVVSEEPPPRAELVASRRDCRHVPI
jgi:hypothetical protein